MISDETTAILVSKVQKLEFLDGRYKLQASWCCQCKTVAIRHHIANCLDVFCHNCYGQYYQQPCPVCDTVITESMQDDEFEKTVFKLKVACEFKKNGCQTIVTLGDYLGHIKACNFSTQNLLPKVFKADPHADALEQINANVQVMKNVVQDIHSEIKQLKDAIVKNTKWQEENALTPSDQIEVPKNQYSDLKAGTKKLEDAILEMKKAFDGTVFEIPVIQDSVNTSSTNVIRETLPRNIECLSSDSRNTTFNWTMIGIKDKMELHRIKRHRQESIFLTSEEFSIPSQRLKFRAILALLLDVYFHIYLKFTSESSDVLSKFVHSRKYVLVDQSNSEAKQDIVLLDQPGLGHNSTKESTNDSFCYTAFFPLSVLQNSESKYVMNDGILIRIVLEPIEVMFKDISSMDGTLLLRINNYTKRKQEERQDIRKFLMSECFYTSAKGYRMNMDIKLDGYVAYQGSGILISPVFKIGEWDDLHSYPIKCKYTRILMDQSDAQPKRNNIFSIVFEYKFSSGPDYSVTDLIMQDIADTFPYLMDNSLLIKFVIEEIQ